MSKNKSPFSAQAAPAQYRPPVQLNIINVDSLPEHLWLRLTHFNWDH